MLDVGMVIDSVSHLLVNDLLCKISCWSVYVGN